MRRKVPKKNISSDIADIEGPPRKLPETPIQKTAAAEFVAEKEENAEYFEVPARRIPFKKIFFSLLAVGLVAAGWFGVRAYARWHRVTESLRASSREIGQFLQNGSAGSEVRSGTPGFNFSDLQAIFTNAGAVYGSFGKLSEAGIDLANVLDSLEKEGPDLLFGNRGGELIDRLKKIKADVNAISDANKDLSSASLNLSSFLPGAPSPLALEFQFDKAEKFLDYLTNWLGSPDTRHVLVLFGNSAELRPGGGFTGSYADVSMRNGSIASIDVRDINDADRLLTQKIVPPKPLQAIASRWRAADANWFFDFGLSGAKTTELVESSKLYSASSTVFDATIAVSPQVVADILEITGPISLPDKNLTLTKDNFLLEIQKDVQARQAAKNAPKEILAELEPLLVDKLRALSPDQKSDLASRFLAWVAKKDLMFYGKDPALEKFFTSYGAGGAVFDMPANFNGDYLAVVNANIGSKTDAVISQKVLFQSQLNLDGTVSDHLTVTRQHNGNKASEWWYRVRNNDYLQVFTPIGPTLKNLVGDWKAAGIESGKNVFAAWVRTNAGAVSTVKLDYSLRLFTPPADGVEYELVFEKQAASSGSYQFEIYAPAGYRWKENNLPVFEFKTDDPDGRMIFSLTLEKIQS